MEAVIDHIPSAASFPCYRGLPLSSGAFNKHRSANFESKDYAAADSDQQRASLFGVHENFFQVESASEFNP